MTDKENNIEFFRICVLRICYNIITTPIVSAHLFGSHLFVGATNCLYSGLYGGNQTMTWRHQVGGKRLNIFFLSGIYSGHREKSVRYICQSIYIHAGKYWYVRPWYILSLSLSNCLIYQFLKVVGLYAVVIDLVHVHVVK